MSYFTPPLQFGKYLEDKKRPEWADKYVDYKSLKDLIKAAVKQLEEAGPQAYSPRTTSLTVQRAMDGRDNAEETFFKLLEAEVDKIGSFTASTVNALRERLFRLEAQAKVASTSTEKDVLLEEAQRVGDEFLQLEKYTNLNYMAFHKILKKHDKNLPHTPCRQFYISHLHNQPWIQGNYSDLLLALSHVYSELRGDVVVVDSTAVEEDDGKDVHHTIVKYWINMGDVSAIKHHILQHLPVYQFSESEYSGDSQLVNSVYLDNSSLEMYHSRLDEKPSSVAVSISWFGPQEPSEVHVERKSQQGLHILKGDHDTKDEFILPEGLVVKFLEGEVRAEDVQKYWREKGLAMEDITSMMELFKEVEKMIDSKQLKPMVRTQYMQTYFQIPFDPTVRIKLDTNICMIKENPEEGPSCTIAGRWYRDPSIPIHRTEITRFPHAVLELKLALANGETTPEWVQELVDSGMLTEIDKFSKHIHGTATLFSDMVQALPYWVDDESVRASMLSSAPEQSVEVAPTARDQFTSKEPKPRKGQTAEDELREPLLRRESTRDYDVGRRRRQTEKKKSFLDWWFAKPPMATRPKIPGVVEEKSEPKTFFANERTFLSWLHMSLTMGSIAAAMVGFETSSSSRQLTETNLIAAVLLPVAILMSGYALLVFHWRSQAIRHKTELYYDDRRGPLALTVIVVSALSAIFLISIVDLFAALTASGEALATRHQTPMEWYQSTLLYRTLRNSP